MTQEELKQINLKNFQWR